MSENCFHGRRGMTFMLLYMDRLPEIYPRILLRYMSIVFVWLVFANDGVMQRWNFHRLSKNELDMDIILDISDDPYNGQCARCGCVHIHERELTCPRCGLALGPGSKYGVRSKDDVKVDDMKSLTELKLPDFPSSFSFIVFECSFVDKLGCTLVGNGPVAIEKVVNTPCVLIPGTLYHAQGEYSQSLVDRGLLPSIGDIVLSVDGVGVGHLSSQEVPTSICVILCTYVVYFSLSDLLSVGLRLSREDLCFMLFSDGTFLKEL